MSPRFLNVERVLRLHSDLIAHYWGTPGVRDTGLLVSAISQPMAMFGGEFLHADLFEMAAAYLFHIVSNHPFLDGNKRTGAAAAVVFLALNDVELAADEAGLVGITLGVATGATKKAQVAEFFRSLAE